LSGWIKLHRSLIDWEWYSDANVKNVFLHLMLTANFEDKKFQGNTIKRGQVVISPEKLGAEIGLKRQPTRTALDKLKSTNEITTKATNKYTVVTLVNYELYQSNGGESNQQKREEITSKEPASNQQDNHQVTTTKEVKNIRIKELKKNTIVKPDVWKRFYSEYPEDRRGSSDQTPWKKAKAKNLTDDDFQNMLDDVIYRKANDPQWLSGFVEGITKYISEEIWKAPKQRGSQKNTVSDRQAAIAKRNENLGITDNFIDGEVISEPARVR